MLNLISRQIPALFFATTPYFATTLLTGGCTGSELQTQRPGDPSVEFSLSITEGKTRPSLPVLEDLDDADAVIVSIQDSTGSDVYTAERIDLFQFNDDFVSHPISLSPGSYEIVQFFVVDASDNVLYATPIDGSPNAHLVIDPLPIGFPISADAVTTVHPEVLSTEDTVPGDFGYASFGLSDDSVVEPIRFLVAALAYNVVSGEFEATTASIAIEDENGDGLYGGELDATVNHVPLPQAVSYDIEVSKYGFDGYQASFSLAELAEYSDSPLVVALEPSDPVLDQSFTQPFGLGALINECCRFVAQTFTAGISGNLAGITIDVSGSTTTTYHLHVSVRSTTNGAPTASILGEAFLDSPDAPIDQYIEFTQPISVVAGQTYAIAVDYPDAPPAGAGHSQGLWEGSTGNAYAQGRLYFSYDDGTSWSPSGPDNDVHFQTYVNPLP